jgi:hypothetical protein
LTFAGVVAEVQLELALNADAFGDDFHACLVAGTIDFVTKLSTPANWPVFRRRW